MLSFTPYSDIEIQIMSIMSTLRDDGMMFSDNYSDDDTDDELHDDFDIRLINKLRKEKCIRKRKIATLLVALRASYKISVIGRSPPIDYYVHFYSSLLSFVTID